MSEASQRPAGWRLLLQAAQHTGGLPCPTPQEGSPIQTGLTQLFPPPPAAYLPQSLLTACFRRGPRPAPLMEAPVCGASRPSFRRRVKETGTASDPEQEDYAQPHRLLGDRRGMPGPCHL